MPQMQRPVSLLAAALGALACAAPVGAGDVATLRSLGAGDAVFGPSALESHRQNVTFRLPRDARQGRGAWYLLRLRFRLEVAPHSGPGRIYVMAYTNGEGCAQIRFDTARTRGRGLLVRASELGLVAGSRERTSNDLVHELEFRNFLQFDGVRGGRNVLTLEVQQHGRARAASVRVFADSGIERSLHGPAELTLEPFLETRRVEVGRRFRVRFRITNASDRRAAAGTVRVLLGDGTEVAGPPARTFGRIPPRAAAEGAFTLVARRAGRHEIDLSAESVSGSPLARLAVVARPPRTESSSSRPASFAGGAAGLIAVAAYALRRRRRARTHREDP